jgi:hypothetical protein
MKEKLRTLNTKTRVLISLLTASVLTVGSTVVVLAAIPDTNGVIHACYTTGLFSRVRIIDSANSNCNFGETALTWNQAGPQGPVGPQGPAGPAGGSDVAYAHITATRTESGQLDGGVSDADRSKNITATSFVTDPRGYFGVCITAAFEPKSITSSGALAQPDIIAVRNTGLNPTTNGWSDTYANQACGNTGNAYVAGYGDSTFITLQR